MAELSDKRLDAAMQLLQATLTGEGGDFDLPNPALLTAEASTTRSDADLQPDAQDSGSEADAYAAAESNDEETLDLGEPVVLYQDLDLAELASLSDVSIAPEDMPLVIGAGAAGILAIALIADSGGGGGGGGGEAPTEPTSPTDPTDPTDPSLPVDNSFDLLGDNPAAGTFTITGTTGEVDVAQFAFDTAMGQALSEGVGQVFNLVNFDASEGDRIQFVQAEGSTLTIEQFIEVVDPIANGFADTTTFNFLTAADELSAQIVAPGSFDPPADATAPFFTLIEVV